MSVWRRRVPRVYWALLGVALFLAIVVTSLMPPKPVSAAELTTRSLTLQAGATDGGSKAGGTVNHLYTFTIPTTGNVGSIQFLYCVNAGGTCTTPSGLNTSSATMGTQSGATGFSINTGTAGAPYITRSAASITGGTAVSFQLLGVVNPSASNTSFYVRISTFVSTNVTGSPVDTGTVAASTANQITLTGTMPESLIFCTGATVNTTSGFPDCSTATAGSITFNQLFSPTDTATATSMMAASTNALNGYSINVYGATLTSGSYTIAPMSSSALGTRQVSQFGMNLVANTTTTSTPAVGANVNPAANGTDIKGQATAGYNTTDFFKFNSSDSVANSQNGGNGPTNSQIYTISYIVNVSGGQLAGTYTTTLTYICTPTF